RGDVRIRAGRGSGPPVLGCPCHGRVDAVPAALQPGSKGIRRKCLARGRFRSLSQILSPDQERQSAADGREGAVGCARRGQAREGTGHRRRAAAGGASMSAGSLKPAAQDGSLLRRVSNTRLRDVLRGRLTATLDIHRMLAESGLPAPLAELVQVVVRGTRLWRGEKADVARELIAHFQDGLTKGESPQTLANSVGGPRTAAPLVR